MIGVAESSFLTFDYPLFTTENPTYNIAVSRTSYHASGRRQFLGSVLSKMYGAICLSILC